MAKTRRKTTRRARKPDTISKSEQLRQHFRDHPDADPGEVSESFGIHNSAVYTARKVVLAETADATPQNGSGSILGDLGPAIKDVRTIQRIGVERVKKLISLIETIG